MRKTYPCGYTSDYDFETKEQAQFYDEIDWWMCDGSVNASATERQLWLWDKLLTFCLPHTNTDAENKLWESIWDQREGVFSGRSEIASEIAKARRVNFQAHLDAGFTEAQALELCKSLTI